MTHPTHFRLSLLVLLLLLCACCLTAAAADGDTLHTVDLSQRIFQCGGSSSGMTPRGGWSSEAESAVRTALQNVSECFDLTGYEIPASSFGERYASVVNNHGEFFYVDGSLSYSSDGNGYVTLVYPMYRSYSEPISTLIERFNAAVAKVVNYAKAGDTPLLRAMLANKYMCDHITYDNTLTIFDAYSALVLGTAVCQGYMGAYNVVMRQLGIPCTYAESTSMKHIWNVIQINGSWYHVDVTWNDSEGGNYDFFLRSDGALTDHYLWTTSHACTSTRYDDAFWTKNLAGMSIGSSAIYYLTRDYSDGFPVLCWSASTEESTALYTIDQVWRDGTDPYDESAPYYQWYFGTMTKQGGRLYFVVPDGVMSVSVTGGSATREMTIPSGMGCVYNSRFSGSKLKYSLGTTYTEYSGSYEWSIDEQHVHVPVDAPYKAPDCTEPGSEGGKCCQTCGLMLEEGEEIAPLGHDSVVIPGTASTCSQQGLTEGAYCDRCKLVLIPQSPLPTLKVHHSQSGVCVDCSTAFVTDPSETLILPAELTLIDAQCLSGTGAKAIIVPFNNVTIQAKAFDDCENLELLFIPSFLEDTLPEDALTGVDCAIVYYQ